MIGKNQNGETCEEQYDEALNPDARYSKNNNAKYDLLANKTLRMW